MLCTTNYSIASNDALEPLQNYTDIRLTGHDYDDLPI